MCFSVEADLVAGAVVTAIGVDALRHVRRPSELPLAALPSVLGAHLLVEVVVWRGLEGQASRRTLDLATWAYALIAYAIVPVLAAVAVTLWEPAGSPRRLLMLPLVALAVLAAAVLLWWQVTDPVEAVIVGHHIDYVIRAGTTSGLVAVPYVVGTCGPALLSSDRALRLFGVLNVVVVAVLAVVEREGLVSLWCAWAAVTSVVIAARMRTRRRDGGQLGASPPSARQRSLMASSSSRRSLPSSSSVAAR